MNFSKSKMWVCVRKVMPGFGLGLFLLLFCQSAFSQSNLGRISGSITDQSGGAIANAAVTVTDVDRGLARPLMTDNSGQYSAGSLIPGSYIVRAEAQGFRPLVRQDIGVGVGGDVRVDLVLQPGAQTETITVTGELPMINTSSAVLGGAIENRLISELPLNGRTFLGLLDYNPGLIGGASGNANQFASNGNRTDANVWVIDGLYSGDAYTGWSVVNGKISGGGATPSTTLPLDSILELNTQANPKAEWGFKPGSVVQVGLKSGTNALHGTLFAFGRDKSFNARNAFNPAIIDGVPQAKAPYAMTQWGGSVGGPIIQDKLFYFGSLERWKYNVGAAVAVDAPTVQSLGGDISNSIPDALFAMKDRTGNEGPNQLSLNLAGCGAINLATNPTAISGAASADAIAALCASSASQSVFNNFGGEGRVNLSFPTTGGSWNYMGKVDYRANDRHMFNGTYFTGRGNSIAWRETTQPYWRVNANIVSEMGRGVWIWTPSSTWLSEARFGYNRLQAKLLNHDCVAGPDWAADYDFVSGSGPTDPQLGLPYDSFGCAFPLTQISGFGDLTQENGAGPVLTNPHTFQALENLSWTRGTHQFKFGFESHWIRFTGTGGGGRGPRSKGQISIGSPAAFTGATPLQSFLAGRITSASIQVGPIVRNITSHYYGAFLQDDWRVTPRITLNLGLRYEFQAPYRERDNLIGNFDPAAPSGVMQQTDSRSIWNADKNNFSPRVGVAWDVTGQGTTVVRLGGGILFSATSFSGFSEIQTVPSGATFYNPDGSTFAGPGNNVTTIITNNTPFNWQAGQPIFDFATGSGSLSCGNGQKTMVDPDEDGIFTPTGPTTNPAPCIIFAIDPNLYTPYVTNWSLSVQQAFGSHASMDLAYVGNHATGLRAFGDLNQPEPGATNSGSNLQQNRRPFTENCPSTGPNAVPGGKDKNLLVGGCFPWLSNINYFSNIDYADYNAFQGRFTLRNLRGFSHTSAVTIQRALQQFSGNENVITNSPLTSNSRPHLNYGPTSGPWNYAATLNYDIPGVRTPGQLLEGWAVNASMRLRGKTFSTPIDNRNDVSGTGTKRDHWILVGDKNNFIIGGLNRVPCYGVTSSSFAKNGCSTVATVDLMPAACIAAASDTSIVPDGPAGVSNNTGMAQLGRLGCFAQRGAAIVPPSQGTFGTMGTTALNGVTYRNLNLSVTKMWTFRDRYTAQFRAEIHNVLNRTQYGGGGISYSAPATGGLADDTPNTGDGIVIGDGGARGIQFGLKLGF